MISILNILKQSVTKFRNVENSHFAHFQFQPQSENSSHVMLNRQHTFIFCRFYSRASHFPCLMSEENKCCKCLQNIMHVSPTNLSTVITHALGTGLVRLSSTNPGITTFNHIIHYFLNYRLDQVC